jgi:hypothetical protein
MSRKMIAAAVAGFALAISAGGLASAQMATDHMMAGKEKTVMVGGAASIRRRPSCRTR